MCTCQCRLHQVLFQVLLAFLWRLPVGKRALMRVYIDILVCVSLGAWALDPVPELIKSSFWACKAEGQPLELVDQHISTCKSCTGRLAARDLSVLQAGTVLRYQTLTSTTCIHGSPFCFLGSVIPASFSFFLALAGFLLVCLFHSLTPQFSPLNPKFIFIFLISFWKCLLLRLLLLQPLEPSLNSSWQMLLAQLFIHVNWPSCVGLFSFWYELDHLHKYALVLSLWRLYKILLLKTKDLFS